MFGMLPWISTGGPTQVFATLSSQAQGLDAVFDVTSDYNTGYPVAFISALFVYIMSRTNNYRCNNDNNNYNYNNNNVINDNKIVSE